MHNNLDTKMIELLNKDDHQELVLMLGSKAEWQKYLGLDTQTANALWARGSLQKPTDWLRKTTHEELNRLIARHGSTGACAEYHGVSESFLRALVKERHGIDPKATPNWTLEQCLNLFEKYKSVRFVSRMTEFTEATIRKEVERLGLEITDLIDYSLGDNSNAKGRRAELDYARLRGDEITGDRNKIEGSQADWDFDDKTYGKVNVKSSRQHRFKAQTRKGDPFFGKFSTSAAAKCDHFAFMLYDAKCEKLLAMKIVSSQSYVNHNSVIFTLSELTPV